MRGKYRHIVTFQSRASTKDTSGQPVETYSDMNETSDTGASIDPVNGREFFAASGEHADVTHTIGCRARTDISPNAKDRILFGTRVFDIKSRIDVGERQREWVFMCTELLSTAP